MPHPFQNKPIHGGAGETGTRAVDQWSERAHMPWETGTTVAESRGPGGLAVHTCPGRQGGLAVHRGWERPSQAPGPVSGGGRVF